MEHPCAHCDHPDSALLRVVLIGEIIRADEAALYTLAEICHTLGIMKLAEEDEESLKFKATKQGSTPALYVVK